MKKAFLLLFMFLMISCVTGNQSVIENSADVAMFLERAQQFAKEERYIEAINLLLSYKEINSIASIPVVDYNIGFYYYKSNDYTNAKKYFDGIVNSFLQTTDNNPDRKFAVLSEILLTRMTEIDKYRNDPYHVQDEDANQNITPSLF